ncbi:hypothetical protein FPANT_7638 [Fusarium pseudoanthophilum]|uniref:Uncharacterized protein n=1 Tax=Fusarium pseudoanthophilum TaxID=48495 RepID=A0A8H5L467_9HYPO|nr:hypothetical protein FPANT_7638 [Fusarium pseudoanthophilum]
MNPADSKLRELVADPLVDYEAPAPALGYSPVQDQPKLSQSWDKIRAHVYEKFEQFEATKGKMTTIASVIRPSSFSAKCKILGDCVGDEYIASMCLLVSFTFVAWGLKPLLKPEVYRRQQSLCSATAYQPIYRTSITIYISLNYSSDQTKWESVIVSIELSIGLVDPAWKGVQVHIEHA